MTRSPSRASLVAADLRRRIQGGEWPAGERLPGETALAAQCGVSRATLRQAMKSLEEAGLVRIEHGRGTFVTPFSAVIRSGLQELRSMTETITEQGHRAGMEYRSRALRPASAAEAERLRLTDGGEVLALERALTADGQVVAFSYDAVDAARLPPGFRPAQVAGSVFDLFDRYDLLPEQAMAEVRPVLSQAVGWGPGVSPDGLYLLLEQTQYLADGSPLSYSRIYFVEDRFRFAIVRKRT